MIIISSQPGQLGNLILVYAHFMSYGIENNIKIVNPAFYPYRSYFKKTLGKSFLVNKMVYSLCYYFSRILSRLHISKGPVRLIELDWEERLELEQADFKKWTVLCAGMAF